MAENRSTHCNLSQQALHQRGANHKSKKASVFTEAFALNRRLAMTYSHMGRPHTTIGAIVF
ncbi:hypothetical protein, partial [Shewanella dokdonensis]|uniref:hypothetical protein n=1 Tax=Shewanella dokdonensis TaxID=712036 RepID=UPI002010A90F